MCVCVCVCVCVCAHVHACTHTFSMFAYVQVHTHATIITRYNTSHFLIVHSVILLIPFDAISSFQRKVCVNHCIFNKSVPRPCPQSQLVELKLVTLVLHLLTQLSEAQNCQIDILITLYIMCSHMSQREMRSIKGCACMKLI